MGNPANASKSKAQGNKNAKQESKGAGTSPFTLGFKAPTSARYSFTGTHLHHAVVPLQGTKIFSQQTQGCAVRADLGLMQFTSFGGE